MSTATQKITKIQVGDTVYEIDFSKHSHNDENDNQTVAVGTATQTTATFGKNATVKYIAGNNVTLTGSASQNTITIAASDSKVTATTNHYEPQTATASALTATATSTTAASWGSTKLVTGVTLQRDERGHVTGLSVDSVKLPSNPDTNIVTSVNGQTGSVTISVPAAANDARITVAASTSGATSTTFGEFTTNQSTAETIYIPVVSTTAAGLMSSTDKTLLDTLRAEWEQKNHSKVSISSFSVSGQYQGANATVSSVSIEDGFAFNIKGFQWSLRNSDYLTSVTLEYPYETTSNIATTATATAASGTITSATATLARLRATEVFKGVTSTATATVSASVKYAVFYGASSASLTAPASSFAKQLTTDKDITLSSIDVNDAYMYVFLPKNLYNYSSVKNANDNLTFYLNGLLINGGMSVVGDVSEYSYAVNGVSSTERAYWICRSDNKLTKSGGSVKIDAQ